MIQNVANGIAMKNKEAKSSPHQEGKFYFVKLDFASQNKEAKILSSPLGSDFSFGKTWRIYVKDFTETRSVCKYRR